MLEILHTTQPDAAELTEWNEHFRTASPQELLNWAAERWDNRMALSSSFGGAAGMVLPDITAKVAPEATVLYIDTGLLFGETYQLVEQVRERYGIDPVPVRPVQTLEQQAKEHGPTLWERNPDRCCQLRKVAPLAEALTAYDAWITGIRRGDTAMRANAKLIEWSAKYSLVKLNPLVFWSEQDVWQYIYNHNVPYNPLLDQGYRSLGCFTCTRLPTGGDPRSGRWASFSKTECGLHIEPV